MGTTIFIFQMFAIWLYIAMQIYDFIFNENMHSQKKNLKQSKNTFYGSRCTMVAQIEKQKTLKN